jgi:protoheme IX farnesyltransferase
MYREDYARAGYLILPNNGREESVMAWLTVAPSIALVMVSLIATATDTDNIFRPLATLILGSALLYYGARLVLLRSRIAARQLLRASIAYLPLEFLTLVLGRH